MYQTIENKTKIDINKLSTFRKNLHQQPEVSGHEVNTAKMVNNYLQNCQTTEIISNVGGHGILAIWDSGLPGETILFRAELDALPIQEINDFAHKSMFDGVSHKCGHDGHATILCGMADYLAENPPTKGKVVLLFQPAEENGEGAIAMLNDPKFQQISPDFVFALHNLPGYPLGQIVVKDDSFTAAVNSIIIKLKGKTAHAAEPENGINPALAVADIIKTSLSIENNRPEKDDMSVITPVFISLGEKAYGISADEAEIHFTLRCWNNINLRQLEKNIEDISNIIARQYKLKVSFEYTQTFDANINHPKAVQYVRQSAELKNFKTKERPFPFKWGEDFGAFTSKFKGCMFGLGAGEEMAALHNPDYDFPDELIEYGVEIFSGIKESILND